LKVIVPEIEGTHSGYLEVYRREEIVVFQYEASKDGETQAKKLSRFQGLLVVDAEHRYNELFETLPIVEAGCNAHGRRKFRDAEAVQPILGVEGGQFISAMYVAENAAQEQGLTGDALRAWRQTKIQPITATFQVWLDAVEPTLTPSDPLRKGVQYYQRHGEALRRFLDHPELPLDNSACEREFQTVAKARASWLFAGGTEGAHRAAVLLGIVASCRNLQIDIQSYLTWAFERLGTHKAQFGLSAAQLTPAAYRAARAPPDG
jgi:transposase